MNEKYMKLALKEANKSKLIDEVPVGCVVVFHDKVIAKSHNLREKKRKTIAHAEIIAITKANKKLKSWRLKDCEMYVTLEPCLMCAGAIIQSRIKTLIYGAKDLKGGAFGGAINVNDINSLNHHVEIIDGVLQSECSSILSNYFKNKR